MKRKKCAVNFTYLVVVWKHKRKRCRRSWDLCSYRSTMLVGHLFFLTCRWLGQVVKCVKKWFEPQTSVILPNVFSYISNGVCVIKLENYIGRSYNLRNCRSDCCRSEIGNPDLFQEKVLSFNTQVILSHFLERSLDSR